MRPLRRFRLCAFSELCDSLTADGVAIVSLETCDTESFVSLARRLGRIVTSGTVVPNHPLEEGLVYEIRALNEGEGICDSDGWLMYSTTMGAFPCHTDGYCSPEPPDIVLLLCMQADANGGESYVTHVNDVLCLLDSEEVGLLSDAVFPSLTGVGPILWGHPSDRRIRFNELELTRTRFLAGRSYSSRHEEIVARLSVLVGSDALRTRIALKPSDCLIIDNRKVLHGRGLLSAHSRRHLRRLWVRKD